MSNREIKFRFWDKTSEAWLKEDAVTMDGNGKIFLFGEHYPQNENIVPLGYTGLKDKKGKEIYDGDVLFCEKAKSRMPSRGTLRKKDPKQISGYLLVEWRNAGFHFDFIRPIPEHKQSHEEKKYTYAYYQFSIWDSQQEQPHVEIIGNIYENPDLLQ